MLHRHIGHRYGHTHGQHKLDKVGNHYGFQTTQCGIEECHQHEHHDSNRVIQRLEKQRIRVPCFDQTVGQWTKKRFPVHERLGNFSHSSKHPTENNAVHKGSEHRCLNGPQDRRLRAAITQFSYFYIGHHTRVTPLTGEENRHRNSGNNFAPPEPVTGDTVLGNPTGDRQRCIGCKRGRNNRSAQKPPAHISTGNEKALESALGRTVFDQEPHRQ